MIKAEVIEKSAFCFCLMLFVTYAYHVQQTPNTYKPHSLEISESAAEVSNQVSVSLSEITEYSILIPHDDLADASEVEYEASSNSELSLNLLLAKVFSPFNAAL